MGNRNQEEMNFFVQIFIKYIVCGRLFSGGHPEREKNNEESLASKKAKKGLLSTLNANEKTSQAKTEVVLEFAGKTVVTILGEKSFDGMVIAETKL